MFELLQELEDRVRMDPDQGGRVQSVHNKKNIQSCNGKLMHGLKELFCYMQN